MAFELNCIKKFIYSFVLFSIFFCGELFFLFDWSDDRLGFECKDTSEPQDLREIIIDDKIYCEETMMQNIREFVDNMRENNHTWCDFKHKNVGNPKTQFKSETYACFPSVPAGMEIEVICPMNSTGYREDPHKTVKLECIESYDRNVIGIWSSLPTGHCGCHYDEEWVERVVKQMLFLVLVAFFATSLIVCVFIFRKRISNSICFFHRMDSSDRERDNATLSATETIHLSTENDQ